MVLKLLYDLRVKGSLVFHLTQCEIIFYVYNIYIIYIIHIYRPPFLVPDTEQLKTL